MELKPGYKQSEVGVIPEDWEVVTASDACSLVVDCKNRTPPIVDASEYAVVRTTNVRDGQFIQEDLRFTDEISYREWTARAVPQAGDIMITREAPLGEVCAVPETHKVCLGQRMMIYRPSPSKTDSRYLLYSLMSLPVRANLMRKIGGSTVGHAKVDDIRFLKLPLPPLSEQRTIATLLSDTDALLASLKQLIAKKRDIKQAAMQELLTGKRRLPGFEGEWEVKRLGVLCSMKSGEGITAKSIDAVSPFPCYGGNGLRGFTSRFTHEGDYCLIGRVGALCGNLLKVTGQFFASEHAIVVSAFDNVDVTWLTLALGMLNLNRRAESSAQPVLTVSKLERIEVDVPSTKQEQTAIAAVLSEMDAELAALEVRRDKTRELKRGMMQELLTGRIRLK
jgi:type I restriction enzyme S subunit